MTLRLPSNTVPFSFYRVPAQIGKLQRAARLDLPQAKEPSIGDISSAPLIKAMAEAKARGEFT